MRSLFLFGLGGFCGVIATVLLFTLDTDFSSDPEVAVVGNARVVFKEDALATMIKQEIAEVEAFSDITTVEVRVEEEGVIRVGLRVGSPAVGVRAEVVADPNIVDGKLQIDVLQTNLGEMGLPEPVSEILEREIGESLDRLDPGVDYRLVSITTTNRELGLEIQL